MKRCRHGQQQRAFRAMGLENFTGFVDRRFAACNHGLRGVIEVDRFHDFFSGFST